jgi:RNA polymerase sigma-70 factor (ECF subfamily)
VTARQPPDTEPRSRDLLDLVCEGEQAAPGHPVDRVACRRMRIAINKPESLIEAARAGDQDAFRRLIEPHRGVLYAHCYRMLASPHDAEDALQEALLRAWRGLSGFRPAAPIRPWLYRIATNASLDAIAKRPRRHLIAPGRPAAGRADRPGAPLAESGWLEPYPDEVYELGDGESEPGARYEQREGVELAFVAALQHLPARQRAVLVLRDVLGFSAREVADSLGTTAASVNSALQRARRTVEQRLPARSQQATLQSLGDARVRELVQRYIAAWERHDIDAIRELLVEDAVFAMPPYPEWWHGRDAIAGLMAAAGTPRLRDLGVRANGQPAIAWFVWEPDRDAFVASSLEVLTLADAGIEQVTAFVMPELFAGFGLPEQLAR